MAALVPALRSTEGFWSASAAVDPLGSARKILAWRSTLVAAGWKGELFSFDGGHSLPPEALQALRKYLTDSIENTASKEDPS